MNLQELVIVSVEDFEKINGYPQNDGTYIASVKYTLVLTPSDKMVGYVRDFEKKEKKIAQSIEDDKPKAQEIRSQSVDKGWLNGWVKKEIRRFDGGFPQKLADGVGFEPTIRF